ncbi:hypothetical protein CMI37_28205 [Candidatus Pacearchaeota archaeon]|nr:hypothetical protein [Candidatus Pacearchaeota archaeon]|tara:strand:- start:1987 stop:2709 length:723 start_codon:yes stop_codon:yes gene_type:complete
MSVANPNNQTIATNNNSVLARIEDLIGTQHSDANWDVDVDAAYSMAVASVVDIVPPIVLLKYTESGNIVGLDADPTTLDVDGKKILHITRNDGDSVDRDVKAVSLAEFSRAKDTDSMYLATVLTPVWTIIPTSGTATLNIFPIPTDAQTATVYVFPYPTAVPYTDDTTTRTYDNIIAGVPNELIQAIVLQSAINVLQAYLGWAVLDEEDQELTSLITAQMQTYKAELAIELSRYVEGKVE